MKRPSFCSADVNLAACAAASCDVQNATPDARAAGDHGASSCSAVPRPLPPPLPDDESQSSSSAAAAASAHTGPRDAAASGRCTVPMLAPHVPLLLPPGYGQGVAAT